MTAVEALFGREAPRAFTSDERGNVAIIFAITSFMVVSMVGGAVDLGRAYSAKAKLQAVSDAATLAAGSAYVNDPNHNVQAAIDQAHKYFQVALSDQPTATHTVQIDETSKTVKLTADVVIKTPFLSLTGINSVTLSTYSEVTATEGVTGGGSTNEVELVMMLDTTGSMGTSDGTGTTKIAALKTAATNMVDILIPDSGTIHAKIALAPFAPTVKMPESLLTAVTGKPLTKTECTQTQNVCVNTTCASYRSNGTCRTWNQSCSQQCTQTSTRYLRRCVTERLGTAQLTDAAPGTGTYVPALLDSPTQAASSTNDEYTTSLSSAQTCTPNQAIVPLTSTKATLKSTISGFAANGSTAGWLGTQWAWYLISPQWSGLFTGTSAPQPYNTDKLKKIAVLMTDGEYNMASGVSADSYTVSANAVATCSEMKKKNIEVYTIGFKLDNQLAKDTLSACATDANHYFLAENAAQLDAAFREVAFRAVALHVAK